MENQDNLSRQIEALQQKLDQGKAKLSQLKARQNALQRKETRKLDTRRKILTGAVVLKKAGEDPEVMAQLIRWLDAGLTEERDRALFPGLAAMVERKTKEAA